MRCKAIGIWYMAKKALEAIKADYLSDSPIAIEEALKLIEDDLNVHTVGTNSYANAAGFLQLDTAYMKGDGKSCQEILRLAGQRAMKHLGYAADFCMVAMDRNGEYAAFSTNGLFPFATIENNDVKVHYLKDDKIIDEDIFLKEDYRGD